MLSPDAQKKIEDFARSLLDAQGGNKDSACDRFIEEMHDSADIADIVDDFIGHCVEVQAKAIFQKFGTANYGTRGGSDSSPAQNKPLDPSMAARWGASIAAGLGFVLPSGGTLGDATRSEVSRAADQFAVMSKESLWKCKWLRLIAQGLPDGKTVRDHYKTIRLTELAISVEKEKSPEGVS